MTLYIKQQRLPADEITGIFFSYSPLTEEHCVKWQDFLSLGMEGFNREDPIFTVCRFTEEKVNNVRYDEIYCDSKTVQVGSVYIPKALIEAPYPEAIRLSIAWIYAWMDR